MVCTQGEMSALVIVRLKWYLLIDRVRQLALCCGKLVRGVATTLLPLAWRLPVRLVTRGLGLLEASQWELVKEDSKSYGTLQSLCRPTAFKGDFCVAINVTK